MPTNERNSRIRRDRRTILGALNTIYPGSMPGDELFAIVLGVNPEYARHYLVRDLTYLAERRYVEFRGLDGLDQQTISVKRCAFRLTAAGTDVANQMVVDPAIDI